MAASSIDGLYFEFHIPLGLKTLIEQLIVNQPTGRNTAGTVSGSATNREWFSQPRPGTDSTTEVITTRFKLPLSVNEISFDILRVPCSVEVWYLDRLNNWRPVLDNQRVPVGLTLQSSSAASWYSYKTSVYPIVAQAMQIRITRNPDSTLGTNPYVVGLKDTLIRRNVYDRSQGKLPFGDEQDALGNVISKYVQDWDASQAIDNKPYTFWRSAPMPDPNAVVNLYLDTRSPNGGAQYMDALFLDPVYSNQKLNIYYSSDDGDTGSTRLSPITLQPEQIDALPANATDAQEKDYAAAVNDLNTNWRSGRGRWDSSVFPAGVSRYRVPASWGPMAKQDAWIGLEWIPDFGTDTPPPGNPVLFEAVPSLLTTDQFSPSVYYDSGAGAVVLKFYDGSVTKLYPVVLSGGWTKGTALRIVAGWSYNPDTVYLAVQDRAGNVLGELTQTVNHPGLLGTVGGLLTVGTQALVGSLTNINWLNPQTVATAINSVFGPVSNPVLVSTGPGYVTNSLPGTADAPLADTGRDELASPYIYRRGVSSPSALAANEIYYSGFTTWSQTLTNGVGLVSGAIADSFTPLKNYAANPTAGPIQGNDYWVFPGGTLKMPAVVMNGLTALTETVLGRPSTTETRLRFNTESVHQYDTRTVTRDAAVAYFAGISEVQPLLTTHLAAEDPVLFQFDNYTEDQNWILDNHRVIVQDTKTLDDGTVVSVGPITTAGSIYAIENSDFDRGLGTDGPNPTWTIKSGTWEWDNTIFNGRSYPGTALATASGVTTELWSTPIRDYPYLTPQPGAKITVTGYVKWSDLAVTNNAPGIQLGIVTFDADGSVLADDIVLAQVSYSNWATHQASDYRLLSGTWTVPGDGSVANARVRLSVTDQANAGSVWFDSLTLASETPVVASVSQGFDTVSDFARVRCEFTDTGVVRSDSMWGRVPQYTTWTPYDLADSPDNYPGGKYGKTPAQHPALNPDGSDYTFPYASQQAYIQQRIKEILAQGGEANDNYYRLATSQWTGIDETTLAYYTGFISLDLIDTEGSRKLDGGTWADPLVEWSDDKVAWGSLDSLVTITVLPDRIFQGQRVLHFTRRSGAGYCGVKVRQWTNFVPNVLFRICARWYKPRSNNNNITLILRRNADGVVVYREQIDHPATGYWYEHASNFQAVPDGDQSYTVELVTDGDSEDELYLSDLWVELSHVRYFLQLGDDGGSPIMDVTDLRYADSAIVSCSDPVHHFYVEARIYTPRANVTGCILQPFYLK